MASVRNSWMPWFASAAMAFGPAVVIMGCGGGGGGGRGSTAGGATPGSMDGLSFAPEELPVVAAPDSSSVGGQFQLALDAYSASNGQVRDVTRQASFASSDTTVARINGEGLVEAVSPGVVTITANYGGLSVTKEVEVVASVGSPAFTQLKVYPNARVLPDVNMTAGVAQDQQLVVVGIGQDGKAIDLTRSLPINLLDFDPDPNAQNPSPLPVSTAASLSLNGLLHGTVEGEDVLVTVELNGSGQTAAAHIHVGPGRAKAPGGANGGMPFTPGGLAGATSPVDQAVLAGLQAKGISPAPASSDGEFLRRLYSDALGRLPGVAESEAFLASADPDKRAKEVDRVVAMPEFATHWASRIGEWFVMSDVTFDTWAADQLNAGRSLQAIVSDLVTGTGAGGTLFDAKHTDAGLKVDILLLAGAGMTAECAKCHDHPVTGPNDMPRWVQADRYPLDAFFAATNDEAIPLDKTSARTGNGGVPFQPGFAALDATKTVTSTLTTPLAARRTEFATLFTGSSQFRRGMAHRIWADVVQPLLDPNQFIAKNLDAMASPAVLAAITTQFEQVNGNLKDYLAAIFKTKTYALGSEVSDVLNDGLLVRRVLRRQHAEPAASLVSNMTGAGPNNMGFFQDTFGFPLNRARIDERVSAVNMSQALVFQNSPVVHTGMTAQTGVPAQLATDVAAGTITMQQAIGTLWVRAYSRQPAADEVADAMATIQAAATPRAGLEDVATALMSSIEAAAN